MLPKSCFPNALAEARSRAGLSQRALAERAGTAQSVVARIELGESSPTIRTLEHLVGAAGFELVPVLRPKLVLDPQLLDDVYDALSPGQHPNHGHTSLGDAGALVAAHEAGAEVAY
mgnify:CR=1 FL=1